MNKHSIGDDPRLRKILVELKSLIEVAEKTVWSPQEAKVIIEALRLGVPPPNAAVGLTVGRKNVLARISRDLDNVRIGKSRLVILKGNYGMGKTHTLRVFQEFAHQNSFASSLVELSVRESPLHNLALVYKKIVNNLSSKAHTSGSALPVFLNEWANQIRSFGATNRSGVLGQLRKLDVNFCSALTFYFECQNCGRTEQCSHVMRWMTGERLSSRELSIIGVSTNVLENNALTMLGNLVKMLHFIGINGLVILFDEADRTLSFESDEKKGVTVRNLNILMRSSNSFPHSYFIYSTPPAFFNQPDVLSGLAVQSQNVIELQPLDALELEDLAYKIRDLHLIAYEWQHPARIRDAEIKSLVDFILKKHLIRSSIRYFVRTTVEILDICQQESSFKFREIIHQLYSSTP